jgi:hypothetical protein
MTVIESVVSVAVNVALPAWVELVVNVATPLPFVVPETVVIVLVTPLEESVTVFPETALEFASYKVTVIVDVVVPSEAIEVGLATTVDWAAATEPTLKVTEAVWVTVIESVVSVAVNVALPAWVDFVVNVATPLPFVVPETVTIVLVTPVDARVTVLLETGLEFASFNVTVIVDVVVPSAVIEVGLATTVDWAAVTAPAVKVTEAVCVTVSVSVLSVAVKVALPAAVPLVVKVATPLPFVVPETVTIVLDTPVDARVTVFPETGLEFASFNVTEIVDVVVPSAVIEVGLATTVDWAAVTDPEVKVTEAVWVTVMVSVVSVAVNVAEPAAVPLVVKVATPLPFVVPETVTIVLVTPVEARVTVLLETGLELASFKVTVIVEVVVPSAVIEVGLAAAVDTEALTAPAVKVTDPVWVTVSESEVSVAVKIAVPAVVDFVVKVATPLPFVVPETVVIVLVTPEDARVTVFPETGFEFESFNVTVIVEVVVPSAAIEAELTVTVDCAAVTAFAV